MPLGEANLGLGTSKVYVYRLSPKGFYGRIAFGHLLIGLEKVRCEGPKGFHDFVGENTSKRDQI